MVGQLCSTHLIFFKMINYKKTGTYCVGCKYTLHARTVFLLFLTLFCFAMPLNVAADNGVRKLVLQEGFSSLPLAPFVARIEDPRSEMTSRKVLEALDRGDAEFVALNQSKLGFGLDGTPSWLVLRIQNSTQEENFVFSLTEDLFYSQGAIKRIILYSADQNNREVTTSLDSSFFKFEIPRNTDTVLLLYIDPVDYFPLILTPQISTETDFFILDAAKQDGSRAFIFLLLGGGLAAFLMYAFKSARFLPHFVCFCTSGVLLVSSKIPSLYEDGGEFLQPFLLFLLITSMGIGTFLQNKITIKDKNEILSVGMPFILMVLSLTVVFFLPEGFGLMNVILLTIPAALLCFSFVVLSLAFFQDGYKASIWNCFSWLFLALTMILFLLSGFDFYVEIREIPVSLPYVTLVTSIIFLFLSIMMTHSEMGSDQLTDLSVLPTSVKDLKEAEEEGEYSRLLTVVERERQMMAELRQIDGRRRKDMQKAKESADEANRAKSAFLAVISHEIRTPMTGIMGLVRLLMDTPLSAEQQKYAKSIMESGESMTLLLNDILDFEKIETGKMTLEEIFFDVKQIVQSTATLMAGHAQNKNIHLSVEVHPNVPIQIKGDPSRLRQVLLNLVGNAIKFTEEGGVTIHLKRGQHIQSKDEKTKFLYPFTIEIVDTGIGIAKEALEDLFNPFSQADKSIAGKYGGSGLGLAICQRLIELMGGEIAVESTLNEGSKFMIHLFVEMKEGSKKNSSYEKIDYSNVKTDGAANEKNDTQAQEERDEEENIALPYQQKENLNAQKILIVEDNLVSQQVIETFLKKQGHDVTACNNAEDALILAKDSEFDIVFMDWELPGMSGPEAIKKIRSEKALHIPHVILLTGHRVSIEETGLDGTQLSAIVNKPVMPEDLEDVISFLTQTDSNVRPVDSPPAPVPSQHNEANRQVDSPREPDAAEQSETYESLAEQVQEDGGQKDMMAWNYKDVLKEDRPPIMDTIEALQDTQTADIQGKSPLSFEEEDHSSGSLWNNDFFDRQMISSLLETLGEHKVRELLKNVFEKTDEIVQDLESSIEAGHLQEISARAHELKGMAGNFALLKLHNLAAELERDIKTKAGANAQHLLEKINEMHLEIKDTFSKS